MLVESMDLETRQTVAQMLTQRRREVLGTLVREEEQLHWLAQNREIEFTERGQQAGEAERLARLDERTRWELSEIDAALDRLRQGRYGVCEDCGRTVSIERLKSMAAARRCAKCQLEADRRRTAG
jgi:DnaK suppressor protein